MSAIDTCNSIRLTPLSLWSRALANTTGFVLFVRYSSPTITKRNKRIQLFSINACDSPCQNGEKQRELFFLVVISALSSCHVVINDNLDVLMSQDLVSHTVVAAVLLKRIDVDDLTITFVFK